MKSTYTRRAFITGAGTTAGLAALALAGCSPNSGGSTENAASAVGWDEEYDFVVVGSGTAAFGALVAANTGASVLVVEKGNMLGGTTMLSGMGVWVPCNSQMKEAGVDDSPEQALTYLEAIDVYRGSSNDAKQDYIDNSSLLFRWLNDAFGVSNTIANWGDYHNAPGQVLFGRSLGWALPDNTETGAMFASVSGSDMYQKFVGPTLEALGAVIKLNTEATDLARENGVVCGIVAKDGSSNMRIKANKGVLLGAGGFEHNKTMREAFLRGPIFGANSVTTNTGDGHRMGIAVGAALGNMGSCWSIPFYATAGEGELSNNTDWNEYACLPGAIIVNKAGRRFMDEGVIYGLANPPYYQATNATSSIAQVNLPAFLIFDQDHADHYGFPVEGDMYAAGAFGEEPPSFVAKYDTLNELAEATGIDAEGLNDEVVRFNGFCETGTDMDFHRGEWIGERMTMYAYSNPDLYTMDIEEKIDYLTNSDGGRPDLKCPYLGPVATPPFYVAPMGPGTVGTTGGLCVNADAQVLDEAGNPIEGLYSCGNNASCIFGSAYPGAGGTVAPGIYQAVRAANHALAIGII